MNRVERAVACFEEGFSCAQAVLSIYGPRFGLERELALRVAGAYGGGMARMGQTCGAVTGALMVIGLKHGKTRAHDERSEERAYGLVQEFVEQFEAHNGSITCKELLGFDVSIAEERSLAMEQGLFETLCPKLVREAAEVIEQIVITGEEEARAG